MPTNCDYSGIGNDRDVHGIVSIQQLERANRGDVLILFIQDYNNKTVNNVLRYAKMKDLEISIISAVGSGDLVFEIDDTFIIADLVQIIGHMIGRLVNFKLKTRLGYPVGDRDLIENDLAQRRLIGEKNGL